MQKLREEDEKRRLEEEEKRRQEEDDQIMLLDDIDGDFAPPSDSAMGAKSTFDELMASNNWVISGKHTKSGKPLLANDPHLIAGLPCFWAIQHLEFFQDDGQGGKEKQMMVGASMPGVPTVMMGRTKDISWGITAASSDVADIYEEKIDES